MSDTNQSTIEASPAGDGLLDWLFLDLNSYFASVEQQDRPELRGRPVIVVPVKTDHTCAIAASKEAKRFGIKTGTQVGEAKARCAGLVCVLARHDAYVKYHARVLEEVDHHIPVTQVCSIDEMACRLVGSFREPDTAIAIARRIKEGLRKNVGEVMTCSVGLSTNRFLAKVASDMQKPDGLVTLRAEEVPVRMASASIRDFPGVGPNMEKRLYAAGILDIPTLFETPRDRLRAIWGGVEGERFWFRLHGTEIGEKASDQKSVSHSHVLPPVQRPSYIAEQVLRRLVLKAASRVRRMGCYATGMEISVRVERGPRLTTAVRFQPACDSPALLGVFNGLWAQLLEAMDGGRRCKKVGVVLSGLVPADSLRQLELFGGATAQESARIRRRERASRAMDALNGKFGRDTVTIGLRPDEARGFTGTKVAFNRVPELDEFHE